MRFAGWKPLVCALALLSVLFGSVPALSMRAEQGLLSTTLYLPFVGRAGIPSDGQPSWGAPIAVSPLDGAVWVVNPDSGSLTMLAEGGTRTIAEIPVGGEPWSLAIAPDGRTVYFVDRANGALVLVDATTLAIRATLPVGPEPIAVALSPSGACAYLTLSASNEVAVLDTAALTVTTRIPVADSPYAIAITDDGDPRDDDEQIIVTHLLAQTRPNRAEATDDGREGRVSVISARTHTLENTISLPPDAHGFPNLLSAIALHGNTAWVPLVRAAPALPNSLTTIVFAAVSVLDLDARTEAEAARLNLNDLDRFGSPVNNPVAAVPSPDGNTLYVVLAGSDLVEVIDIATPEEPRLVSFLRVGRNPRGIALSADGRTGYVMNYLSRSVTVLDLQRRAALAERPVTNETLEPDVLRGKILFHNASDPRLSRGAWISCASCHPDSGTDGVTWIFPDGPRQSPPLWNAAQTLPWHWSAALDEPHDVEETVQLIQQGWGLAPGADPPQLGAPNAARSTDLDALAAFLMTGIRAPSAPSPAPTAAEGRALFQSAGCAACHGGPAWTSSALLGPPGTLDEDGNGMVDGALRQVGTLNPSDIRGAEGFDPPSLLLVGQTPPYLHDGSMPTLEALLRSGHPTPQTDTQLNDAEIAALSAFLRAIGPATPPIETP